MKYFAFNHLQYMYQQFTGIIELVIIVGALYYLVHLFLKYDN